MADSISPMFINLESAMFSQLLSSCNLDDSSNTDSGLSFSDLLQGAMSGTDGASSSLMTGAGDSDNSTGSAGGMQVSNQMVNFIENEEGFSATPYRGVDSSNETTGYGHVVLPGENYDNVSLTQNQAQGLLNNDLKGCVASVNNEFKGVNLNQNQFDALVSFSYNLGTNIWSQAPKLTADIKSGASPDVLKEDFLNCSHVGGTTVQGLVNRRLDEWQIYTSGDYPTT